VISAKISIPKIPLSSFRNDLARPVHYERDRRVVGLAEISYSHGFTSVDEQAYTDKNIIVTRAEKIVIERNNF
jgi:hypothetical protein